jgi:broad specificity phosphatase PhoE
MSGPGPTKWPSLLVVMRHAESEANLRRETLRKENSKETHVGLAVRDVDVELTENGERQGRATGRYLDDRFPPFDVVYVSPYRRTRRTADAAVSEMAKPPRRVIEERLREKEFGILEGLTKHGIEQLHPEEHRRKIAVAKYYYRPPGGESFPDINLRVHSFIGTMVREHAGERVLVVTHSVVVLCFRRLLERMEEEEVLKLDREDEVKNASLLVYEAGDRDGLRGVLVRTDWNLAPWEKPSFNRPSREVR